MSTADLIATRARQLEMRKNDLATIHDNILKSRLASIRQFEHQHANTIASHDFHPGRLVLVRNSGVESDLGRKTKPRYFGPMVVIRRTRNGTYRLMELDGMVSKLRYAAFRIIPYFARSQTLIPVTHVLDRDDLAAVVTEAAEDDSADETPADHDHDDT